MTPDRQTAFEGLFRMALAEKSGPYSPEDLLRYAKSVESCQVLERVRTDEELGRFYVEEGFVQELENIPDSVIEKLDFSKIGKEMRQAEKGVFTQTGYVLRLDELYDDPVPTPTAPQKPDYVFQLSVWDYFAEESNRKVMRLDLPATEEQLHQVLEDGGIASWEEAAFTVKDSALPDFPLEADSLVCIDQMNELAAEVRRIMEDGKLVLYKALLTETKCDSMGRAMRLAGQLDDYILSPNITTPEDVARDELRVILSSPDSELVMAHVDLYRYGEALMKKQHSRITGYGLLERKDGQPIQSQQAAPRMGGMEMR